MPLIKITQDDVDKTINVFDAGYFTLKCEKFEIAEAKTDKSANYVFTHKVTAVDDEDNKKFIGRTVILRFNEKAMGFSVPYFRACGADIPEKLNADVQLNPDACVGKSIKAKNSPAQDKNRNMQNNWGAFVKV